MKKIKQIEETNSTNTEGNIKPLRNFIKACEADPLSDDPIDEMLITERVNISRELDKELRVAWIKKLNTTINLSLNEELPDINRQ